jgi:hypothetical protein
MNTLKLLRKAVALSALPLLFALTATQAGCLGHGGPSAVAQGQIYESGDPTYDDFFSAVHELQVEMAQAPKAEKEIRMDLGRTLGVEADEDDEAPAPTAANQPSGASVSTDNLAQSNAMGAYGDQLKQSAINAVPGASTVNAVNQQVQGAKNTVNQFKSMFGGGAAQSPTQAAAQPAAPVVKEPKAPSAALLAGAVKKHAEKYNVALKLEVDEEANDGDGKVTLRLSGDDFDGKKLASRVEDAAKDELQLVQKMQKAKKKLDKLAALAVALEDNVGTTFRKSRGQASDVKQNLEDSQALIKLMQDRADGVTVKARQLLSKLQEAANADLPDAEQPPADSAVAETDTKTEAKPAPEQKAEQKAEKPAEKSAKKEKKAPKHHAQKPAAPKNQTALADFEP